MKDDRKISAWERRDFVALIFIPLLLVVRWLTDSLPPLVSSGVLFVLALASVLILVRLYRDVLVSDWGKFRKKLWLKILLCIVGVIAIFGILTLVRMVLPIGDTAEANGYDGESTKMPVVFSILFAFVPLFVALKEEVVLRHVLFFKHRNNKALLIVLFFVSAFIFGAIHINSFDGNLLLTVPYMFVGAFFNLLYLFSKNIWFVLCTHLFFNFIMAFLPAIFIPVMLMFQ